MPRARLKPAAVSFSGVLDDVPRLLGDELRNARTRGMASDEASVDKIHAAQIGLRFRLQHAQSRRTPAASQVDS
jgi:hypothetical protein